MEFREVEAGLCPRKRYGESFWMNEDYVSTGDFTAQYFYDVTCDLKYQRWLQAMDEEFPGFYMQPCKRCSAPATAQHTPSSSQPGPSSSQE
eukprot:1026295-Rhodomonas_salina.1